MRRLKSGLLLCGCVVSAVLCFVYSRAVAQHRRQEDARAIERVIFALQNAPLNSEGKIEGWQGDVASLARLGIVPPEIAEAETVSKAPRPFHGYYFAVMEPEAGKGPAFCAFPADPDYLKGPVIIVRSGGSRQASWGIKSRPVRRWPSDAEIQTQWSTYGC